MALHEEDFYITPYNLGTAWRITGQGCAILHIPTRLKVSCGTEDNYYANMRVARNELATLIVEYEAKLIADTKLQAVAEFADANEQKWDGELESWPDYGIVKQ